MLPDVDRNSYEQVVKSLRSRFKAGDIEELRGLEFHYHVQVDETIEELGLELQSLGRKAFPSITGHYQQPKISTKQLSSGANSADGKADV